MVFGEELGGEVVVGDGRSPSEMVRLPLEMVMWHVGGDEERSEHRFMTHEDWFISLVGVATVSALFFKLKLKFKILLNLSH